jgi:hypothetical protein
MRVVAANAENAATLLSGFGVRVPDGAQNTRSDKVTIVAPAEPTVSKDLAVRRYAS